MAEERTQMIRITKVARDYLVMIKKFEGCKTYSKAIEALYEKFPLTEAKNWPELMGPTERRKKI